MFAIHRLMAAGVTAVVLGCAPAGPTEPSLLVTGLHNSPISRPAGGRCTTTFELTSVPGVFPQVFRILLTCNLRHLGLTSGVAIQEIDAAMNITNSTTYTAANGDELYTTFAGTGTLNFPNVTFEGIETYVGGTGRFEGATGSAALSGSASLILSSGLYQTAGSLAF